MEIVFNKNQEKILTMQYDRSGRLIQVQPTGPVEGLNVTYDQTGRITRWTRGDLNIVNVFDEKNMIERKLANRAFYRYIYKNGNKVWVTFVLLLLASIQ